MTETARLQSENGNLIAMPSGFSYQSAFARNVGWVTSLEQDVLRAKRIAIAGMGGVGGVHLLTLARLGVGRFNIADFDTYDLANFNRQAGAGLSSLDKPKVDVMARLAKDINPEIDLRTYPQGIGVSNLSEFLADVDLYIDGLDFFAFDAREAVFAQCAYLGIPATTAAPLGMGASVLNFLPGQMTFEEYFQLAGGPEEEKAFRFLLGLSPAMLQRSYLVDPTAVDLARHRGPSTAMACQLCAGIAATEALKILLKRGKVRAAPHGFHFDAYRNKLVHTWRPWGNRNPVQRLALLIAKRQLKADAAKSAVPHVTVPATVAEQILNVARWAPSGDNTQPWRFEIKSDRHIVVHGFDTREHCVYDLEGRPSQIAHGALLESISIAASAHGLVARIERRLDTPDDKPLYDVHLVANEGLQADPLTPYIPMRSVQRRPMSARALTTHEKHALEASVGISYRILWLEGWEIRLRAALLMFHNAKLRLTIPEAYEVHENVIQWNAHFSEEGIPDKAVGLDPLTTRLMHWAMRSWRRVEFLNTFFAGTWLPRIELDLIPALACGAHVVIAGECKPEDIDDYVQAGRAFQRFWLTATKLGLQFQPEMTPLVFSQYARDDIPLSKGQLARKQALAVNDRLERLIGSSTLASAVMMGRIGAGASSKFRSTRLPLRRLIVET